MRQDTVIQDSSRGEVPSLKEVWKNSFSIGAAIEPYQTTGKHAELLKKHFSSIVAENVMKPGLIAPKRNEYFWDDADSIIAFAGKNHLKVRFHTLVWHNQTADWFFQDEEGNPLKENPEHKQLLLDRLKEYIRVVGNRYKNAIESWDVVNEVIDPDQPDGLRRSTWFNITGTDYIETAFRTAREVLGPEAKLFINDYNTNDPKKREFLYELVKDLQSKGVPIDGVGHQMHINLEWPSVSTISETIDLFANLGLDNKVTEMDISIYENDKDTYETVPQDLLAKQGKRYQEIFDLFKSKKGKISQVITWGIADDHTWKTNFPIKRIDLPLLFDQEHLPKPAFWGIVDPSKLKE
ncbi:endo-1,4-beta-xylanase [Sediminibacillus massiliensis]|uniref:endo-1,4-beta-xylanase n=1 Tax=Sediminibacillus massiliensis TaxID=1926277 RepID=UPI000988383C|nr:endo-1,4-beta-xylanase [Sediminibacillus massiliensis]